MAGWGAPQPGQGRPPLGGLTDGQTDPCQSPESREHSVAVVRPLERPLETYQTSDRRHSNGRGTGGDAWGGCDAVGMESLRIFHGVHRTAP